MKLCIALHRHKYIEPFYRDKRNLRNCNMPFSDQNVGQ